MAAVSSVSDTSSSSGRAEDTSSACRELLSGVNIFVRMKNIFYFCLIWSRYDLDFVVIGVWCIHYPMIESKVQSVLILQMCFSLENNELL